MQSPRLNQSQHEESIHDSCLDKLPLAPLAMVIHAALLWVVHEQPVAAVTLSVPDPPPAAALALVGLSEFVHVTTTAAWLMVNVCPATVSVPLRVAPSILTCRWK